MVVITYEQVLTVRRQLYDVVVQKGEITPLIYPWDTLPFLYLFIALFFHRKLSRNIARSYNIFTVILIAGHSLYIGTHRRCLSGASGYIIGLVLMWGIILSVNLLLLHNPSTDFARLQWRKIKTSTKREKSHIETNGSEIANTVVRRRKREHDLKAKPKQQNVDEDDATHQLVWQTTPAKGSHRLDWIVDLVVSFRGPHWNYRILTLPKMSAPPAPAKTVQLSHIFEVSRSSVPEDDYDSPQSRSFRHKSILRTIVLYVMIDLVKVVMMSDVYFMGLKGLDAPSDWPLFDFLSKHTSIPRSFWVRFIRLSLSLTGVLGELSLIFSLSPLFFYVILPQLVDPRRFTYAPLTDKRLYPEILASPFPVIPNKGLGGLWGKCWHQMFRFGITEPSRPILRMLEISPRSQNGKAIVLFVAFGLSGLIHMCGSYTSYSIVPSKPLMPLLFFLSQAAGIVVQSALSDLLTKTFKLKPSMLLRQVTNTFFAVAWLYITGPMLADDFARGGIWLFEPIPVSPIRGFRGQGWWHWYGIKIEPWSGLDNRTPFWERGIGIF